MERNLSTTYLSIDLNPLDATEFLIRIFIYPIFQRSYFVVNTKDSNLTSVIIFTMNIYNSVLPLHQVSFFASTFRTVFIKRTDYVSSFLTSITKIPLSFYLGFYFRRNSGIRTHICLSMFDCFTSLFKLYSSCHFIFFIYNISKYLKKFIVL